MQTYSCMSYKETKALALAFEGFSTIDVPVPFALEAAYNHARVAYPSISVRHPPDLCVLMSTHY
jgi:hypothetical protein